MRTWNPALNEKVFSGFAGGSGSAMTLNGAVTKTGILLILAIAAATFTWAPMHRGDFQSALLPVIGGAIGAFIVGLITSFKREWSPVTAPIYAVLEGLFLGGVSALYDLQYPGTGIVMNAVALTFGTLFCLLVAYITGIAKPSQNFKLGVIAATGSIALLYFVSFILSLFGVRIPFIHGSGPIGIAFSVFVVILAALNLVLDFDYIEEGVEKGAPKYMEWYAGFGLLVTLVWLYLEILRLLSKLQDRRR